MDISAEARERLAREMEARRLALGLEWREVAARAGVSYEIIRRLRTSKESIRPLTLRKIDAGLRWQSGSIERVLNGGEPVPLAGAGRDEPLTALDAFERRVLDADLPYADKAAAIRLHRDQISQQLAELGLAGELPDFVRRSVRRGDDGPAEHQQDARPA